jgi:hypothetical protein
MKQSPSGEAKQFSASQEIAHSLWNLEVHYHLYNCMPPAPYPEPEQSIHGQNHHPPPPQ